jgi:hypothetical protein
MSEGSRALLQHLQRAAADGGTAGATGHVEFRRLLATKPGRQIFTTLHVVRGGWGLSVGLGGFQLGGHDEHLLHLLASKLSNPQDGLGGKRRILGAAFAGFTRSGRVVQARGCHASLSYHKRDGCARGGCGRLTWLVFAGGPPNASAGPTLIPDAKT